MKFSLLAGGVATWLVFGCGERPNDGAAGMGGTGGAMATGGAGAGVGGTGTATGGGTDGAGGSVVGACERITGACTAPEVRVTEIDVGVAVTPYGSEWDTQPLPLAIAALPSGGSRVAWLGTDENVHVLELDCDDQIVGTPVTIAAHDFQALHADDEGGVVLVSRPATGSGEHGCGTGPLCGGTSAPCYQMFLVRFSEGGTEEWATPVTNLSESMEGYDVGARFVWGHYQHHGRIAFDGSNYAAYFCIGITTENGACVDVHEGDRMQVVSAAGVPVNHEQAFEVGCSHSWTTRIVWDPRSSQFAMLCATDNPDPGTGSACRIAQPDPYRTIAPVECEGAFWGGDLVLDTTDGYWTAYTQGGSIQLVHFTNEGPDQTIANVAEADHAKLVEYGPAHLLLAWESGDAIAAQILDRATGAAVGGEIAIAVPDHDYQAFAAFDDGSVGYAAAGTSETKIRIARVLPCE